MRRLGFAVLPVAAAAGAGGLGARRAPVVYERLRKPPWAPPAAAFGPVWSALYVAIATAGWRISDTAAPRTKRAHLAQLALNGAWPAVFFGLRDKRAALAIIALLDLTLGYEVATLWAGGPRRRRPARPVSRLERVRDRAQRGGRGTRADPCR